MCLVKHCLEFFHGIMGIDLGGSQVGMAQQVFDCIQICSLI